MPEPQSVNSSHGVRDRRRHRRVDVLGQVQVHLVSRPMPTAVRDLSPSGIALEATLPIAPGACHHLLLYGVTGTPKVGVKVTAVHCTRITGPRGLAVFLVGFTVGPMGRSTRDALTSILDDVQEFSS